MGSQEPCIYSVPSQLREARPEAYKPRMLLIGPLHHSEKPKAHKGNADSRYLEYGMMEDHKVMYKAAFSERPDAIGILEEMTRTIKEEEGNIRASYAVSTAWILPYIFVELILNDSVFIVEFIIRIYESHENIGDLIVDNQFYTNTILDDLALLENQLPYFCLYKLLNPITKKFCGNQKLDEVILQLFSVDGYMINMPDEPGELGEPGESIEPSERDEPGELGEPGESIEPGEPDEPGEDESDEPGEDESDEPKKFKHFTDMFRSVYMKSLGESLELNDSRALILDMKNANKLSSAVGLKFKGNGRPYSLRVSYEKGCLTMPCFHADEGTNVILRNVIAYEQCHDPENAFTTNYIHFMNCLITSDKDVEILTTSGVLTNGVGRSSMVLKTVNNLCAGLQISENSQYHDVLQNLDTHYRSNMKRTLTRLKKVYFSDLWTGTATITAILLLLLTVTGTVAAILQVKGGKERVSSRFNQTLPNP